MIAAIYALVYQLNDSHTVFIPPGRTETAVYGFKAQPFASDILVYDIAKGGPAANAGLQIGDKILGVNGFAAKRENFFTMMRYFELLNPGTQMDIQVGRGASVSSIKILAKLEPHWANLSFNVWTYSDAIRKLGSAESFYKDTLYEGNIGYLKLRTFMVSSDEVRSTVAKLKDSRALIIDLRGNGGGSMEALTTLVGVLLNEPYEMANMVFRAKSLPVKAKPVRPFIGAPVYVLVDSSSAGASEILARSLQIRKRGTVIGDKTSGRVNVAQFFPETIGAEFKVDFGVEIAVARAVMANGEELEGNGVTPDEFCIPSSEDLHSQKDPCLDRVIALAKGGGLK